MTRVFGRLWISDTINALTGTQCVLPVHVQYFFNCVMCWEHFLFCNDLWAVSCLRQHFKALYVDSILNFLWWFCISFFKFVHIKAAVYVGSIQQSRSLGFVFCVHPHTLLTFDGFFRLDGDDFEGWPCFRVTDGATLAYKWPLDGSFSEFWRQSATLQKYLTIFSEEKHKTL